MNFFKKELLKISEYKLNNKKYKIIQPKDNYDLDNYCELFYESYKKNPYFISNWYSLKYLVKYLVKNKEKLENKKILELGSGLGILSVFLNELKNVKIISSDFEIESCKLTNKTLDLNNRDSCTVNFDWNFPCIKDNTFDIVIASDIIYDIENIKNLKMTLKNILKNNGEFIIANFYNIAFEEFYNSLKDSFEQSVYKKYEYNNKDIRLLCGKKINHENAKDTKKKF